MYIVSIVDDYGITIAIATMFVFDSINFVQIEKTQQKLQ